MQARSFCVQNYATELWSNVEESATFARALCALVDLQFVSALHLSTHRYASATYQ